MQLRAARPADVPSLLELSTAAGWNQTAADWDRLLRLQPGGCFAAEIDGTLAASATVVKYGDRLAWIGMVLTLPEFRGRGLARALMGQCLDFAAGVPKVKLDASDMGKPLYESLGFRDECAIERWVRPPSSPAASGVDLAPAVLDPAFDSGIFGADRSALLGELARYESASAEPGSYAFARPGRVFHYFGPCVAAGARAFEELLGWCAARHLHLALDLFPHREEACAIASGYGFAPARRLTRMVLAPAAPELPDPRIFAAAGFEFG